MSITQGAYAELGVDDLEAAVGFHTDVLGLTELGRESGSVSLGCGVDGRTDLILSNGGGTGVRLVALEVSSEEDLERYAARLAEHGVERDRRSDPRTGVAKALHFAAPSGLQLELVVSADGPAYLNPGAAGRRSGIAPVDYDHIALKVPDPVAMVAFLRDVLDFAVSDEMRPAPDTLVAAWTRAGQLHHDIAMFKGAPGETLHHFALRLESFDHLKHAAHHLAAAGVAIETRPGRHRVGGNVYLFFWAPGGNRYEFSAEMPRVGSRMAVRLVDRAPVVPLVLLRATAGGSADASPGLIVDSLVPAGQGERVDGGYLLSGRWRFVSGVEWCSWAGLAFPSTLPGRSEPEPVVAFVPAADLVIEDTWKVVGLRGTAFNEVVLDRVFIPDHRLFALPRFAANGQAQGEVTEEGTLFKLPFMGMAAIQLCYPALGAAQRALDEFASWTRKRVRAYEHTAAKEAPYSQLTLADATAKWDAAHALLLQYVRDMWAAAEAGRTVLDPEDRARMFAQRAFITRTSAELTNQLFLDSGAMSLFETGAMQQLWRDVNAAPMHMVLGRGDALTSLGRNLMGLPGHHFA